MSESVFAEFQSKVFTNTFRADLVVNELHGGIPSNPDIAEAWIRKNLGEQTDQQIAALVVKTMAERGIEDMDEAAAEVAKNRSLNGFKRTEDGELFIEGRQVKAMLKEAASIAVAAGHLNSRGWGKTNKGLQGFLSEHIFVLEDRIGLGVTEPSGIHQRFVATWKGTGISMEEYVTDAKLSFTVASDYDWPENFWSTVWVLAEKNGLGAARSMGFGTFAVTKWEKAV